ncbi:UNVERIFIED_ORG: hypothetical protein GGE11_004065 [Mycolicibacterium obuense]
MIVELTALPPPGSSMSFGGDISNEQNPSPDTSAAPGVAAATAAPIVAAVVAAVTAAASVPSRRVLARDRRPTVLAKKF